MTPLGSEWKRLLDHLVATRRWSEAERVLRTAESVVESADDRALLELERSAVFRVAGRHAEADAAAELAGVAGDALSAAVRIQVELARAESDARRDPIAALKRAHAADQLAVGNGPPHVRLSTLSALLEYTRRAGIDSAVPGLADMVVQQAGFTRDPTLSAAAHTLRAEVACSLGEPDALRLSRHAHAAALRLPRSPTRTPMVRRAAACRGRAARSAGEMLEALECFEEAVEGQTPDPSWVVDLALARQATGLPDVADGPQLADALKTLAIHDPDGANTALGALLMGETRLESAARVARALPDGPLRLGLEARVALSSEQPDPTRDALKAALADPATPPEARPTLTLLLAALHAVAGDRMDALDCLDALIESDADRALVREARIQRGRLLTRFADYDGAFADAERAWHDACAAFDPRGALHAAFVRAACMLVWDRETDALDAIGEAIAFAERLGAGRVVAAGRLEHAMVGLSHGSGDDVQSGLEELLSETDADDDTRLRTLTAVAIARYAAEQGDAERARTTLAELRGHDGPGQPASPLVEALAALVEGPQ